MTDITAPIRDVTVYSDRALVTRRGTIKLDAGDHELRINDLPQFQRESLRTSGHGPEGTRILNVEVSTAFYSQTPITDILALHNEIDQLRQQQQLLKARQSALEDRRQWLRALGEQSKDFARGLTRGQMKPQDCADFFSFMTNQALQDAEAAQALELELRNLNQEIDAKERELRSKEGYRRPDLLAANVTVSLEQEGELELEISYLVNNASWHPQYDVRVQLADEQKEGEVELTYIGIVQQRTGEEWRDINLALSTARPSLAANPPELDPWYLINYVPPPPPSDMYAGAPPPPRRRMMSVSAPGSLQQAAASEMYDEEADAAPFQSQAAAAPVRAEIDTAKVERSGAAVLFRIGHSVDIPSDNTPHKTTIARDGLPCKFDYVSAPVLEQEAHLRARVTNASSRILLKGEANIFMEGEYVGSSPLKQTAPGETFDAFLGIDDRIKIKHELIERGVEKGNILRDLRRTTYAYRITVHNYAEHTRNVVIRDHLPVSRHERVKVRVQNISPQPDERTKLELLTWNFSLPADGERKIAYRFIVDQPQDMDIIGLPEDIFTLVHSDS